MPPKSPDRGVAAWLAVLPFDVPADVLLRIADGVTDRGAPLAGAEAGGDADGLLAPPPPACTVPDEPDAVFFPPTCTVPTDCNARLPPPPVLGLEPVTVPSGVVALTSEPAAGSTDWAVPVEPAAVFPPPTWIVPSEVEASFPEPSTAGAVVAPTGPAMTVAPSPIPLDWTVPLESEEEFPPPSWAVPLDPVAEFPLPATPPVVPTVTSWLAASAVADGLVSTWLACAVPVELEASLPPPTCAVPVEPVASLSPGETDAGAATDAVVPPSLTLSLGATAADDTCSVPVELAAELLPLPLDAGCPLGADAAALAFDEVTVALGLALTEPTWTVPVEFEAEFPESASAGAAVHRAVRATITPTTRPKALHLMVLVLSRVGIPADRCRRRGCQTYRLPGG
jgi:hypothetical protein